MADKLLVIQVAALGYELLREQAGGDEWLGLNFRPAGGVFPALTCPVQASLRTALPPEEHGMRFNGVWLPRLRRPAFWEQPAALVQGARVWEPLRASGKRVGMLFWQQSLGETVDALLSPAPIHTHGGGFIDAMAAKPDDLYETLRGRLYRRFRLSSYWGPFASKKSTRWIADATAALCLDPERAPVLLFTYLPHLDYDLQRDFCRTATRSRAFNELAAMLGPLLDAARRGGYDVLVLGDYAMTGARRALFPNRVLRKAGLLATRTVRGMCYADLPGSRAFAVADHEIARVYATDDESAARARTALGELEGEFEIVEDTGDGACAFVVCGRGGDWCAYPWWTEEEKAPDYANHVDIHNKPGYDPCELFCGWHPFVTATDPARVKGTHGRAGPGREIAWATTLDPEGEAGTLLDLAGRIRNWAEAHA